jgi:hypothetical protein
MAEADTGRHRSGRTGRSQGRQRRPRGPASALLSVALLTLLGCASAKPEPAALPPVSESKAETPAPKSEGEEPVASPTPPTLVVIDVGEDEEAQGPKSLAVAAREERERRAQAGAPVAVIDNRNLAEFSRDQKLTIGQEAAPTDDTAGSSTQTAADAAAKAARDEAYWRNRGLDIRRQWRAAADRITELEGKSEELRRRFYAADDPYQRDSQIKPEWDHALDDLDATRREVERHELELERFLIEGRQAGAFPGWLREGVDLEPERAPREAPNAEPTEPVEAPEPRDGP